jgi:hypothetical protein
MLDMLASALLDEREQPDKNIATAARTKLAA